MQAIAPRMLIAAPASGGGKTTFACGLMRALVQRGVRVQAFKCGPDYIDPMFHREVVGAPSRNLDLFFMSEEQVRDAVAEGADGVDMTVIEGAMGYYDGIAVSSDASAWDVARATGSPTLLVVDGRGRARSIAAEVLGFACFREPSQVAGVVLNRVSATLFPQLKELVEEETGVPVLGYVPTLDDCSLESRHLGLVTAAEVTDLQVKLDCIAHALEGTVDIDGILELAHAAPPLICESPETCSAASCANSIEVGNLPRREPSQVAVQEIPRFARNDEGGRAGCQSASKESIASSRAQQTPARPPASSRAERRRRGVEGSPRSGLPDTASDSPVIAVARDDAFCFYYDDTLRLFEKMGARLALFSPLHGVALPHEASGLYLGGGYPELHARELSANEAMCASVREAVAAGMPTIAECGGFMYLHERLEGDDGALWPMAGAVRGTSFRTEKLGRFGYVEMTAKADSLLCAAGGRLRAHEFHYWDSDDPGDAFHAQKPQSRRAWECVHASPTLYAGYPHLCLHAQPDAAARFVRACAAFASQGEVTS